MAKKGKKLSQRYVWTDKAARIHKNCNAGDEINADRKEWFIKKMLEHGIIKPVIMEVDEVSKDDR